MKAGSSPTSPSVASTTPFIVRFSGTVISSDGQPVAGAAITGQVSGLGTVRTTTTDANGQFTLPDLVTNASQSVIIGAEKGGFVGWAATYSPTEAGAVSVSVRLQSLVRVVIGGSLTETLAPTDRSTYVGEAYDSDYAWNAQFFGYDAPADANVEIVLTQVGAGNAALQMWAANGAIVSRSAPDGQHIVLPRGTAGSLIVGQPWAQGKLSTPVTFTLTSRATR